MCFRCSFSTPPCNDAIELVKNGQKKHLLSWCLDILCGFKIFFLYKWLPTLVLNLYLAIELVKNEENPTRFHSAL